MPLLLKIMIVIPIILFGSILMGFIIASIMDIRTHYRNKRDIFYQLSKDNRPKRPARK